MTSGARIIFALCFFLDRRAVLNALRVPLLFGGRAAKILRHELKWADAWPASTSWPPSCPTIAAVGAHSARSTTFVPGGNASRYFSRPGTCHGDAAAASSPARSRPRRSAWSRLRPARHPAAGVKSATNSSPRWASIAAETPPGLAALARRSPAASCTPITWQPTA